MKLESHDKSTRGATLTSSLSPGKTKPRLAYVVNSLNPGGTERLVLQMSRSFHGEFEVFVVCLDEPGLWARELEKDGIPIYCLGRRPGIDLTMALKLARFCRDESIDIIHAHQCTPWFYAGLSRLIHRSPRLLLEEHGRFFPEVRNRKRKFVNKHIIKPLTHRFIAVSEDVKNRLVEYEGLDGDHIEVVYNGVEPVAELSALQRDEVRREFGFEPGEFVVGTAGRFDPVKNLPMLMKSLANVRKEIPSVRGLLLGHGPIFEDIRALRDDLGLSRAVVMPGHRDDARRLIPCMDLFILSSLSEGTSLALLEAMAAGVPVAVTAVGGNPEIVTAGESGWVVDSGSVEQLAVALAEAASDSLKSKRIGKEGRRRFLEIFTLENMILNYRVIYAKILNSRVKL